MLFKEATTVDKYVYFAKDRMNYPLKCFKAGGPTKLADLGARDQNFFILCSLFWKIVIKYTVSGWRLPIRVSLPLWEILDPH